MDIDRIALSGVLGAGLYVASAFTAGAPLAPDATINRVVAHYADHRAGVLAGVVLAGLALGALVVFLGRLRAVVAERTLATATVGAWLGLLLVIATGTAPLTAVTWRGAGSTDPNTVGLAFDLANLSTYALTAILAALWVALPTLALWRAGVIPKWLAGLAAVEIAINAVELAGIGARTGGNAAGYAFGLGPFVWMAWLVGMSVTLARMGQ